MTTPKLNEMKRMVSAVSRSAEAFDLADELDDWAHAIHEEHFEVFNALTSLTATAEQHRAADEICRRAMMDHWQEVNRVASDAWHTACELRDAESGPELPMEIDERLAAQERRAARASAHEASEEQREARGEAPWTY
jgi:hypothetical protein